MRPLSNLPVLVSQVADDLLSILRRDLMFLCNVDMWPFSHWRISQLGSLEATWGFVHVASLIEDGAHMIVARSGLRLEVEQRVFRLHRWGLLAKEVVHLG